jgi:integrase
MVLFDAYCGLRFSELAGLKRSAVSVSRGQVRVVHNAVEVRGTIEWGAPKTRAGRRTVPMPPVIRATLAQHLDTYVEDGPDALVFPIPDGTVLRAGNWRSRFWAPATRNAGLAGVRPHDLRHTAVSLWIAAGANPKQIAAWAGHTSSSIVLDRYGHLYDGNEADVLARLDTFLTKPDTDIASPWIPRVLRGNGKPTCATDPADGAASA